jgi:hypothetical protein
VEGDIMNINMNNIFLQNKYTKMYLAIVTKASNRVLPNDIYNETHHIIPRCLYKKSSDAGWLDGSPEFKENKVVLTAHEHLVCHLLLRKMLPAHQRSGVVAAAWRMVNIKDENENRVRVTGRVYAKLRKEHADNHSKVMKSKNLIPWNKGGVEITDEHRENLRNAALQRAPKSQESIDKWKESRDGYKHSDKTKKKQSDALKGIPKGPMSEEQKLARSKTMTGQKKTKSHATNVAKAVLGNISINKDNIEKKVKEDKLQSYLILGWQLGGKKRQKREDTYPK